VGRPFTNTKQDVSLTRRARKLDPMGILQKFTLLVRENDFVEIDKSKDGTTAWFRGTDAKIRLCVDGLTNSATVFWGTGPGLLTSKTFRTVSSLKDWFALSLAGHGSSKK
jgi:hypothetical protein